MENKISSLENYTVKDKDSNGPAENRCRFYYLENDYLWKEFDVKGHYTLEGAFEVAKNIILNDLIRMALKESIKSLDLQSNHFHFQKDGKTEDLRDYIFDMDVLDESSDLFKEYKGLLLENFNDKMIWYYFLVDSMKNADIHDDTDKKTLFDHYFEGLEEFKSRQTFLEYSKTYNGDYEVSNGIRRIHYNFFQYGDYHCIDNSITRKELIRFSRGNNYFFPDEYALSNISVWELFGYYYGKSNGLNEFESIGFACNLAMFFSNGFVFKDIFKNSKDHKILDAERYFNLGAIDRTVNEIAYRVMDGDLSSRTREIFFIIFDVYRNRIGEFEKKTKRLEFRVSERIYDYFMGMEGKSKSDKLYNLITIPKEEVDESLLPDIDLDKDSIKEWKKNNKVKAKEFFKEEWFFSPKPTLSDKYGEEKEIVIVDSFKGVLSPEEQSIVDDIEYYERELEWLKENDPEEYERRMEKEKEFKNKFSSFLKEKQ